MKKKKVRKIIDEMIYCRVCNKEFLRIQDLPQTKEEEKILQREIDLLTEVKGYLEE